MRRRSLGGAVIVALAASFACSTEKAAPAPPPLREASKAPAGGLRPLTSRDEAKPFDARDATTPQALPAGHPPVGGVASATPTLAGTVAMAPEISSRVSPTDTLYLIARSRPTNSVVAVRRETGVRFPFAFELSSADAMVAGQPFVGPFDVTARLSKSGDALPARGDLEGTATGVAEGARSVSVLIERVRE